MKARGFFTMKRAQSLKGTRSSGLERNVGANNLDNVNTVFELLNI
jgi:hypothetical protein